MLPAISEFLKGTVDESLTRLVQPSGIIAAAIFLLLNLLFIFPPLAAEKSPLVTGYLALDGGWQLVIGSTVLLVLSYALVSLSNSILRLMTGELWMDSARIGPWLTNRQRQKYQKLKETLPEDTTDPHQMQERYEFQQSYPADQVYIMPTDLGNALNATSLSIHRRYGIDMAALWPHMQSAIADDTALVTRLDGDKATLDFLLNLSFILIIFAVEAGVIYATLAQWLSVLLSLLFLLLAYLIYRTAVGQARSWGDAVVMAFDLHRNDLRAKLGLQEFESRNEERRAWNEISKLLIWGATDDEVKAGGIWDHDAFFDKPSEPAAPTITCSDDVKITRLDIPVTETATAGSSASGSSIWSAEGYIDYILFISPVVVDSAQPDRIYLTKGPFVSIIDPRVQIITTVPQLVSPSDQHWQGTLLTAGWPHRLLWQFTSNLSIDEARMLRYPLPIIVYKAETKNENLKITEHKVELRSSKILMECSFTVANNGNDPIQNAMLYVVDTRLTPTAKPTPAQITISGAAQRLPIKPIVFSERNEYRWELGEIPGKNSATLKYTVTRE